MRVAALTAAALVIGAVFGGGIALGRAGRRNPGIAKSAGRITVGGRLPEARGFGITDVSSSLDGLDGACIDTTRSVRYALATPEVTSAEPRVAAVAVPPPAGACVEGSDVLVRIRGGGTFFFVAY